MSYVTRTVPKCDKCGHEWISGESEPRRCAKCKTPTWNREVTDLVPAPRVQGIVARAVEVTGISAPMVERAYVPDRTPFEEVKAEMREKKAKRHSELKSDSVEAMGIMPDSLRRKMEEPPTDHHPCCKCMRCKVHHRGGR